MSLASRLATEALSPSTFTFEPDTSAMTTFVLAPAASFLVTVSVPVPAALSWSLGLRSVKSSWPSWPVKCTEPPKLSVAAPVSLMFPLAFEKANVPLSVREAPSAVVISPCAIGLAR